MDKLHDRMRLVGAYDSPERPHRRYARHPPQGSESPFRPRAVCERMRGREHVRPVSEQRVIENPQGNHQRGTECYARHMTRTAKPVAERRLAEHEETHDDDRNTREYRCLIDDKTNANKAPV